MQYKEVAGGICAPKGFAAAGVHCGIRANHSEKYDLALIKAEVRCAAAGVYTTNKVCGAPIKVDRAHLADGYAQAIVVNSGNANTCAANGVALAEECCALVGKALNMDEKDVLPASTGVIGQPMVIDPFARGIPAAAEKLAATAQGSTDAATAIMTTDTHKKEYAIQFELASLNQALMMLEQRTQDLRTAENVAMQSIPMIKTMQFSNMNLVRKINSAFIVTLPVFKQAIAQAIMLKRQRIQAEAMSALDAKTNEMLIRNAQNTAEQSKITARLASGSSIKTETLEKTWQTIVSGIEETKQIQENARKQRIEDQKKLEAIKDDFNKRFSGALK